MKGKLTRREMLKLSGGTLAGAALLGAAGCGGGAGSSSGGTLTLGTIGWEENVVISNLTKFLLEEDLDYSSVEIQGPLELGPLFEGVASGDLAAFQDVWLPNHRRLMEEAGGDIELLEPWYEGTTKYGITVLDYMGDIKTIADLENAGTEQIIGIEPSALFMPIIREEVIPSYNLDMELVTSSTAGMLSELESAARNEEPIVFTGWSPHWMNQQYNIVYLEDPKDAQGSYDDPAKLATVVHGGLAEDDPAAYAFIKAVTLTEDQVNKIEAMINNSDAGWDDPLEGISTWVEENRGVVDPWVEAAQQAQEQAGS